MTKAEMEDPDIGWQQEAMLQRERVRRTDEADGFFKPEDEEDVWKTINLLR